MAATDNVQIYRIEVKGSLDERWSDWFDGFAITHSGENATVLLGTVRDQGMLHGLLAKIRDLGLPLVSVLEIKQSEAHDE
jgi:hypothetical protein